MQSEMLEIIGSVDQNREPFTEQFGQSRRKFRAPHASRQCEHER